MSIQERASMERTGDEQSEEAATQLLRANGAFRRGRGVWGPHRWKAERARLVQWMDWIDESDPGAGEMRAELEELAKEMGLSPREMAVLMARRVQECSLREVAARLGVTLYAVRIALARAESKCARYHGPVPPLSARSLFWEEVRQKRAMIYRRRFRSRRDRTPR